MPVCRPTLSTARTPVSPSRTSIYPGGARIDSSNYDPVASWAVGSQIVALNYQTPGPPMMLNDGKFMDNGGCGYLLKPPFLREIDAMRRWWGMHADCFGHRREADAPSAAEIAAQETHITLTIISGQQIPKPRGDAKGEVIDPYVTVQMHGIKSDATKALKTAVVDNNGFNPVWASIKEAREASVKGSHSTFSFSLRAPELALLKIAVYDNDLANHTFIACVTLDVSRVLSLFCNLTCACVARPQRRTHHRRSIGAASRFFARRASRRCPCFELITRARPSSCPPVLTHTAPSARPLSASPSRPLPHADPR